MEIAFTVTVVNTGDQVILFDTGNGGNGFVPHPGAGDLRQLLAGAGVAPEQVDLVVMTHVHRDHMGGLIEDPVAALPNARYVMPDNEYDFWSKPDLVSLENLGGNAKVVQSNVVPMASRTRFVRDGDEVVSGITAVGSNGQRPGHTSYHLESCGKRLLVLGDVSNHYMLSLQRPDWHVAFDMDKDMAVASRQKVLGMIAADRMPFIGYHRPPPAAGYLEVKGAGYRFVPVGYQLNL
jgi:glyoxylase-like metal-dependent hydrolase (beta-lactamase superfamily II)